MHWANAPETGQLCAAPAEGCTATAQQQCLLLLGLRISQRSSVFVDRQLPLCVHHDEQDGQVGAQLLHNVVYSTYTAAPGSRLANLCV